MKQMLPSKYHENLHRHISSVFLVLFLSKNAQCLHPETFHSVSVPLYSNKGVLLPSTAFSRMIKPRHCTQLILSMDPIIFIIQTCPFSSSFKASRRHLLNLSTKTLLYRHITNYVVPEAFKIVFSLL